MPQRRARRAAATAGALALGGVLARRERARGGPVRRDRAALYRELGPVGRPLQGHTQRVTYVNFSADGARWRPRAPTGRSGSGTSRPSTRSAALTLDPNSFTAAAFGPDGSHLFAVPTRGPGISFDTAPEAWKRQACAVMGGGLTPAQWEEVVPEQDYISVCPSG